jgi:hypothetical protein
MTQFVATSGWGTNTSNSGVIPGTTTSPIIWNSSPNPSGSISLDVYLARRAGHSGCVKIYDTVGNLLASTPWNTSTSIVTLVFTSSSCGLYEIVIDDNPC